MGDRWANSSSSIFQHGWKYDVFFQFRGVDIRKNFTTHLYEAFCRKGIHAFIDEGLLEKEEISQTLVKASEQSRISIIIFTENYVSSAWCLHELVKIMKCRKKTKGQLVFPVFYRVDPSAVRHQRGYFARALAKHKLRFKADSERVQRWRLVLQEVTNLSGWHLGDG